MTPPTEPRPTPPAAGDASADRPNRTDGNARRIDALAARISELEAINRELERRRADEERRRREAERDLAEARSALRRLDEYLAVERATRGWRALAAIRRFRHGVRGRARSVAGRREPGG